MINISKTISGVAVNFSNQWKNKPLIYLSLLILLFLLFFVIRLYKIDAPITGKHSWNQISAASMTKHIFLDPKTIFKTKVDNISLKNLDGYYIQEFPLYQSIVASTYFLFGQKEWLGRLISILFSLILAIYLYRLAVHIYGRGVGFISLFILTFSPLCWYYSRTFMTDMAMLASMIAGFYHFYLWLNGEKYKKHQDNKQTRTINFHFFGALFWTSLAGLFKPFGMFIGVAYLLVILFQNISILANWRIYFLGFFSLLLPIAWILYALQLTDVQNEFLTANQIKKTELIFSLSFYQNMFFNRIKMILGFGIEPFLWGGLFFVLLQNWKTHLVALSFLIYAFIYLLLISNGNNVHEYYQILFIPGLTFVTAIGIYSFLSWGKDKKKSFFKLMIVLFCLSLFTINSIFTKSKELGRYDFFKSNKNQYTVGNALKSYIHTSYHVSQNDKVLYVGGGHNATIYYTGLQGIKFSNGKAISQFPSLEDLYKHTKYDVKWFIINIKKKDLERDSDRLNRIKLYSQNYKTIWEGEDPEFLSKIYYLLKE